MLTSDPIERKIFCFEAVFITSFGRGRYPRLHYYKRKQSSRGVPYTGDLKEKAKTLKTYLLRAFSLRRATPNTLLKRLNGRQIKIPVDT